VNADLQAYAQRVHGLIGRAVHHALTLQAAGQPETTWRPFLGDVYALVNIYRAPLSGNPLHAESRTAAGVLTKRIEAALPGGKA